MVDFIKLTNADDGTTIVTATKFFVKATREEGEDYTDYVNEDGYSDFEVKETPEQIYRLLTKTPTVQPTLPEAFTVEEGVRLSQTPPALKTDTHMENLSKHA